MTQPTTPYVVNPTGGSSTHTYTIVFLHGLGSNGESFGRALCQTACLSDGRTLSERLPTVRFVFPTAPFRRSSAFGRSILTQWFDLARLADPAHRQDRQVVGLQETAATLKELLEAEHQILTSRNGKDDNCNDNTKNIVLGGISQGCAAAVSVLLAQNVAVRNCIGGFVGMSGFLPFQKDLEAALQAAEETDAGEDFFEREEPEKTELRGCAAVFERDLLGIASSRSDDSTRAIPVLLGHGRNDEKVSLSLGEAMAGTLQRAGYPVEFSIYDDVGHWYKEPQQLDDIVAFLQSTVGWDV